MLCVEELQISKTERNNNSLTLVRNVSFDIRQGEMLALVGESGSGKSLTAGAIGGLLPKTLQTSGRIKFQNENLQELNRGKRKRLRGKEIGWVFQDYQGSFTPFMKIGAQLVEVIRTHERMPAQAARKLALDWLGRVGLPPERTYGSYPFQLSGGQRQRAALAAALLPQPSLLIADEPTTALDVLTGEQVMDLIAGLQKETGCAVLFITHDLRHVLRRADRIAVMKSGTIVEAGAAEQIRDRPSHPYTLELFAACPRLGGPGPRTEESPGAAKSERRASR